MLPRARIEHEMLDCLGPRLRAYFPSDGHENPAIWLSQTFDILRRAIETEDKTAIGLACELIAQDPKLPFGKLIKSDLARALKKKAHLLVANERTQIVAATVKLLCREYAPREVEDYCKLTKKLPRAEYMPAVSALSPVNSKSERLVSYLMQSDA